MNHHSVDPAFWSPARSERRQEPEATPALGPARWVRLGAQGEREVPVPLAASDQQLIFQSPDTRLGVFAAAPKDLTFRFSGLPGEHMLVFPKRSVRIQHQGRRAFVVDPTGVVLLDPEQIFFRSPVDPEGDRSVWLAPSNRVLQRVAEAELGNAGARRLFEGGFSLAAQPIDTQTFQLLHQLAALLIDGRRVGPELVDGVAEEVLRRVLRPSPAGPRRGVGIQQLEGRTQHFDELVQETLAIVGERFRSDFAVCDIAKQLCCSYSRLSAEFKRRTGETLHQYRIQLRLRRALLELLEGHDGLAELATHLGFSTHSHFTSSFRATFGVPPSEVGRRFDERSLREALEAAQSRAEMRSA